MAQVSKHYVRLRFLLYRLYETPPLKIKEKFALRVIEQILRIFDQFKVIFIFRGICCYP